MVLTVAFIGMVFLNAIALLNECERQSTGLRVMEIRINMLPDRSRNIPLCGDLQRQRTRRLIPIPILHRIRVTPSSPQLNPGILDVELEAEKA
jgi:hypothetical protein